MNSDDVQNGFFKVGTAWAAWGITNWSDFAAALAAVYTCILIGEWIWKKAIRPIAVMRGWMKPLTAAESAANAAD